MRLPSFTIKLFLIPIFLIKLLKEIFIANLKVAHDVITPDFHAKPGVIALPLRCKSDLEITILAITISLTPGTLALDVSADNKFMFIHAMFIYDKNKLINELKQSFEDPIMRIFK